MDDAGPGGHPLHVPLADHTTSAGGVAVFDLTVVDDGHGFEAAVRVPAHASGMATVGCEGSGRCVVHHQEGAAGGGTVVVAEHAMNREAVTHPVAAGFVANLDDGLGSAGQVRGGADDGIGHGGGHVCGGVRGCAHGSLLVKGTGLSVVGTCHGQVRRVSFRTRGCVAGRVVWTDPFQVQEAPRTVSQPGIPGSAGVAKPCSGAGTV